MSFHRRPQHFEAGRHQVRGHAAVSFDEQVGRKMPLIQPDLEQSALIEIDWRNDGDKIPNRSIRIEGQIAGAERTAQADTVQVDRPGI